MDSHAIRRWLEALRSRRRLLSSPLLSEGWAVREGTGFRVAEGRAVRQAYLSELAVHAAPAEYARRSLGVLLVRPRSRSGALDPEIEAIIGGTSPGVFGRSNAWGYTVFSPDGGWVFRFRNPGDFGPQYFRLRHDLGEHFRLPRARTGSNAQWLVEDYCHDARMLTQGSREEVTSGVNDLLMSLVAQGRQTYTDHGRSLPLLSLAERYGRLPLFRRLEESPKLRDLLRCSPCAISHGDLHASNVLIRAGSPLVVDLEPRLAGALPFLHDPLLLLGYRSGPIRDLFLAGVFDDLLVQLFEAYGFGWFPESRGDRWDLLRLGIAVSALHRSRTEGTTPTSFVRSQARYWALGGEDISQGAL